MREQAAFAYVEQGGAKERIHINSFPSFTQSRRVACRPAKTLSFCMWFSLNTFTSCLRALFSGCITSVLPLRTALLDFIALYHFCDANSILCRVLRYHPVWTCYYYCQYRRHPRVLFCVCPRRASRVGINLSKYLVDLRSLDLRFLSVLRRSLQSLCSKAHVDLVLEFTAVAHRLMQEAFGMTFIESRHHFFAA